MARPQLRTLLRHIHHVAGPCAPAELSDRDLLERFAGRREEAAFAALVQRHGPLVLGVCRRLLRHEQDAEDVFQATFLVLARKAGSVRWRDSIASWLHAVAHRLALKARAECARRLRQEQRAAKSRPGTTADELSWREATAILEEELGRLPDRYRAPLLLCCWEGKARDEAARLLGWTTGTVKGRLERGRELLRRRLVRRGVALSAGLLAVGLVRGGVPVALAGATVRLALAAEAVPPAVAGLADAALRALTAAKFKAVGVLLVVALLATGAGVWTHQALTGRPVEQAAADDDAPAAPPEQADEDEAPATAPPAPPEKAAEEKPPEEKPPAPLPWPRADRDGDPLPAGVAQRFGTTRFRHANAVQLVAFSPDGKLLATGGPASPHVCLWDATTGKELRRFEIQATCLTFSPGGEMLAVIGFGKAPLKRPGLRIWNTKSGILWKEVTDRAPRKPDLLSFSADGARLWAFGQGEVAVWQTGKRDAFAPGPTVLPRAMAAAGWRRLTLQILAVATPNGIFCIEDDGKNKDPFTLRVGTEFRTIAFADGLLAGGTAKGDVHLWEVSPGATKPRGNWHNPGGTPLALAVADCRDGPRVMSVSAHVKGVEVRNWDPINKKEISLVKLEGLSAQNPGSAPIKVVLSPDGKRVAVAEPASSCVRLWDATTGKELSTSPGHTAAVRQVAFLPDGKAVASFGADGALLVWQVGSEGQPRQVTGPDRLVQATAISPDGKLAAVARSPNSIDVRDMATGNSVTVIDNEPVSCLAFAPDGKSLALGSGTATATGPEIWLLADKSRRALGGEKGQVFNLAYSPDGKLLATDEALTIGLWDVAADRKVWTLSTPGSGLRNPLAFDPTGRVLAGASQGGDSVTLYDVATGRDLRRCRRPGSLIQSLAFARGGRLLVVGDEEGLTLWEVATGAQVLHLAGHTGTVNAVAVSPDGNRILSGSADTTVLLWDLAAAWKETTPLNVLPGKKPPTPGELCQDLHDDGATAYRAVWALAAQRDRALPALKKEMLGTLTKEDAERVGRLVADLDDAAPKVRVRALEGLHRVGAPAEPALRKALEGAKSEKLQARLRGLLAELEADGVIDPARDAVQAARAVDLAELIGTAEARRLLEAAARDGRTWPLQQEAKAALARTRHDKPTP
jgi:RNA polymerase sigma factor (sigma-70 family)